MRPSVFEPDALTHLDSRSDRLRWLAIAGMTVSLHILSLHLIEIHSDPSAKPNESITIVLHWNEQEKAAQKPPIPEESRPAQSQPQTQEPEPQAPEKKENTPSTPEAPNPEKKENTPSTPVESNPEEPKQKQEEWTPLRQAPEGLASFIPSTAFEMAPVEEKIKEDALYRVEENTRAADPEPQDRPKDAPLMKVERSEIRTVEQRDEPEEKVKVKDPFAGSVIKEAANVRKSPEPGSARMDGDGPEKVKEMGQLDRRPRQIQGRKPVYPAQARRDNIEGHVEMAFTILPDGKVAETHVLRSSPQGIFDTAALKAVQEWRFSSPTQGGRAVSVRVRQRIRFELR